MKQKIFENSIKKLSFSGTLKYAEKAREMRRAGITIKRFGSQPDTPIHIKEAAKRMIDTKDAAGYTNVSGLSELRNVISRKLKQENGIEVDPDYEITVTIGGKGALFLALMALITPNDEVIIQDPGWPSIPSLIRLAGGVPISLFLKEEKEWGIEEGDIEKLITPRTKMIVINDPHNPTGSILDKKTLNYIIDIAKEYDLFIVTDECYERIIDPSRKHYSIASFAGMKDRTISVFTTTKLYNMYGWRVGYVTANKMISEKMQTIQSHTMGCAPSMAQAGAIAALSEDIASGDMIMNNYNKEYKQSRDTIVEGFNNISKVSCARARGGYFLFPNFSNSGLSSIKLHEYLLKHGFFMVPGIEFGINGEGHLRCSFGLGLEEIKENLKELKIVLEKLQIKGSL